MCETSPLRFQHRYQPYDNQNFFLICKCHVCFHSYKTTGRVKLMLENNIEGSVKYSDVTTKNVEGCVRRLCIVREGMKHGQSGMRIKIKQFSFRIRHCPHIAMV